MLKGSKEETDDRRRLFHLVRPELTAYLLNQHFRIEQIVGEEDDREVGGSRAAKRGGVGKARHDDVGAQGIHDAAGFFDAARRCDSKVQPREDRFAARVAVLVVVVDEDERGKPLPIALATAAPPRRTPIGTASLVVWVVQSPECNDVTHVGEFCSRAGTILAAHDTRVKWAPIPGEG